MISMWNIIISKDGYFSLNLFRDIANEFFKYAKKIPIKPERNMILPFSYSFYQISIFCSSTKWRSEVSTGAQNETSLRVM